MTVEYRTLLLQWYASLYIICYLILFPQSGGVINELYHVFLKESLYTLPLIMRSCSAKKISLFLVLLILI